MLALCRRERELTPQQEALIPVYREKWRQTVLSTQPINHAQATTAVEALYGALGFNINPVSNAHSGAGCNN